MPTCYEYLKMIGIGIHKQFFKLPYEMSWCILLTNGISIFTSYPTVSDIWKNEWRWWFPALKNKFKQYACHSKSSQICPLLTCVSFRNVLLQLNHFIYNFLNVSLTSFTSKLCSSFLFFSTLKFLNHRMQFSYASELLAVLNHPCHMPASLKRIPLSSKPCLCL